MALCDTRFFQSSLVLPSHPKTTLLNSNCIMNNSGFYVQPCRSKLLSITSSISSKPSGAGRGSWDRVAGGEARFALSGNTSGVTVFHTQRYMGNCGSTICVPLRILLLIEKR